MSELYAHQREGVSFLCLRNAAMLCDEMGVGKSRQALVAAQQLFKERKIDRVLVLAPAAVRMSWRDEMNKLDTQGDAFTPCAYEPKKQTVLGAGKRKGNPLPVLVLSYSLLPQKRHVEALIEWCENGHTLLVCDESSFLKNRTAKQTKSAATLASVCVYRWLLTGTPIANGPLDLYAQALVMEPQNGNGHNFKAFTRGPLKGFGNWYQFQARYAVLKQMTMGPNIRFKQVVGYQNIDELNRKFAPYVLRREKKDCLDLPTKSYTVREVQLSEDTWRIYQELRKEALLALPDVDVRPEPNAAVRLLRLCQLTSGHVGNSLDGETLCSEDSSRLTRDVSSEKLSWLVEQIVEGELADQKALIIWCRWRRERERLQALLAAHHPSIKTYGIFGGQQDKNRSFNVQGFMDDRDARRILVAQPHAGGFGLTLTAASTAVYLSNDFSYTTRIQSEDRCHRIGQVNPVIYIDVLAVGPRGQRTVDHHVIEALRAKKDLAQLTCSAWRRVLEE